MFTINQIHQAYSKAKSGVDFPQLVQDLKAIGVTHYEYIVAEGYANYYGADNFVIKGEPKHTSIKINEGSSTKKLKHALFIHQQGQTDFLTFCKEAAEAGVEKWTTNTIEMTVTYLDKKGKKLSVEIIPYPK